MIGTRFLKDHIWILLFIPFILLITAWAIMISIATKNKIDQVPLDKVESEEVGHGH